jgi:hypothetical protein
MQAHDASGEPRDPEQAGILLDRLACELVRASLKNPEALPDLRRDARELLFCLDPLFTDEAGARTVIAHEEAWRDDVTALAQSLEALASILLDRAERELTDPSATGGP